MPTTATAAATMAGRVGGVPGRRPQGAKPQSARPLAIWHFPGRPARSALVAALENDRRRLGLNQEPYAEGFGVSRRTYLRFLAGGKLPKQLRQGLLVHRPRWKPMIDKVVAEDIRFDDLLDGLR